MSSASPIINLWIHSHEEDTSGTKVYRPSSYKFPLSRGRESIDLSQDGQLKVGGPGADDRPMSGTGHWSLVGNRLELDQPRGNVVLDVESLTPDKLVIRKPEPSTL